MAIDQIRGYAIPLNLSIQRAGFTGASNGQVVKLGRGTNIIVTVPAQGDVPAQNVVVFGGQPVDAEFAGKIGAKPWGRQVQGANLRGVGWPEAWNAAITLVSGNYEVIPNSVELIDPEAPRQFATNAQVSNGVTQVAALIRTEQRQEVIARARQIVQERLAATNLKLTEAQKAALPAQLESALEGLGLMPS